MKRFFFTLQLPLFVMVLFMSDFVQSQMPLPAAVTDPAKLDSTPIKELQKFSLEQLYMTRTIGGSSWAPDGKRIAFVTNLSGRNNLWIAPLDGGWPQQLTVSDQRQSSPAWTPDGTQIAYISDTDGNELWDIYLVSTTSGEVRNLTASPNFDDEDPVWSPDGKQLAYMTRSKDSPSFEIDVIDVASGKTRHITRSTKKQWSNLSPIWSPDGKFLAFTRENASGKDSDIFLANLASGELTNLTPHTSDSLYVAAHFSPDGRSILLTSDARNGFSNAALVEISSKKIEWLSEEKWEIEAGEFTPDGTSVLWTANVDGYQQIYRRVLQSQKLTALPLPAGVNFLAGNGKAFSPDGSRLLFEHEGPSSAPELWTLDWKSQSSRQLSHTTVAGVRASDMVEPYLVHYPSRDGKWTLSAFAYIPHNILRNAKYPAIVYIHGGPAAQSMAEFSRFIQYIANQGYVVIAPNYRGSTGYGQKFQDANRMDAGGGELDDVLDAAEFIKRSGFVDPKKLIVMGGSYGGYLSMMAVTKAPQMWAAGVPIVPFVNWFTEFENEDPQLQESDRLFMGDPVKDKALWMDRSPVNFLDKVTAPLLLLAGGNDPRCPKSEAQQVASSIKERGGKVQLKIYENEGHGFARVENNIDAYRRVSDFLKIHVPSPGCGCSIFE